MLYSDICFSYLMNMSGWDEGWWTREFVFGRLSFILNANLVQDPFSGHSYFPEGEKRGDIELIPNRPDVLPFKDSVGLSDSDGLIRFSFCLRLQYQTLTTSFSMQRLSARFVISSLVGLGFMIKALSSETLTFVSIDVRFFRLRPIASGVFSWLESELLNILLTTTMIINTDW